MMLVTRNLVNEFVPGCDLTTVALDDTVVGMIARRAAACRAMRAKDASLAECMFWDAGIRCVGALDPETEEAVEEFLDPCGGWAIAEDNAMGPFVAAHADCTRMAISTGDEPAVSWTYRVGSEPIRTVDVPLAELGRRLGSPLGDALKMLP